MPLPQTAGAVERVCLRDQAYDRLRGWILDGTLAPGEPLRDEALAEALGVSRTPIREALARLTEEGLVTSTSSRHTAVSPVTLAQAREVYPIVVALEALALRLALPHVTPAALDEMRAANQRLATALDACDTGAALEADHALHGTFIRMSGNSELQTMLATLISKVQRIERAFWGGADRRASVADHERLIACMLAGDAARARDALARNWERGLAWVAAPGEEPGATGEGAGHA
jgi:DNA-binding GntR family transcriptional regulator